MRAYLIIIFQVRQQYVTEVPLSEHNNVVKAFPSDRTDQPFGVSILPRGAWRRWSVANAHRSTSSDEDIAIGLIACDQAVSNAYSDQDFGARVAVTMGERLVLALEILRFVGR